MKQSLTDFNINMNFWCNFEKIYNFRQTNKLLGFRVLIQFNDKFMEKSY